MSNIIDQVYRLNSELVQLLEQARVAQQDSGALPPELEKKISAAVKDRAATLTDLGVWYLNTEAKAEGVRAQYAPILEAIEAEKRELENRLEFIATMITQLLPHSEESQIVNERVYIHHKKSERLVVDAPLDDIPVEFVKLEPIPDIAKAKEAIKGGAQLDWAHLETKWNPQIKPGGERAQRNANARLKKLSRNENAKSPNTSPEHGARGADDLVTTQGRRSATEAV